MDANSPYIGHDRSLELRVELSVPLQVSTPMPSSEKKLRKQERPRPTASLTNPCVGLRLGLCSRFEHVLLWNKVKGQ